MTDVMTPLFFRVVAKHEERPDTATIDLEPLDVGIPPAEPGQFSMLYAFGVGEVPISVSGCPADEGVLRHTIKAVGAVTTALCATEPGDVVGVRGPFGTSWPMTASEGMDVVVVGGGIGLAPLRPVVVRVLAQRERFGRVSVVAGAKTPGDLLYAAELMAWRARYDMDVFITVDHPGDGWTGDVGLVTAVLPRAQFDPDRTVAMLCGPEVMMRGTANQLIGAGVAAAQVFVSMERNMQCAVSLCGHCQLGPLFICADGPVLPWARVSPLLAVRRW